VASNSAPAKDEPMAAPVWCTRKITPSTGLTEKRPQMSAVSAEVIEPVPAIVIPPSTATRMIAAGLSRIRKNPEKISTRPA
jgi:hypothetical protein